MDHHRRVRTHLLCGAVLTAGVLAAAPASAAAERLTVREAKQVALERVERIERKLSDEGATGSKVPGCWRETKRRVGCLGIVKGRIDGLRWRCAVPMTVRKRATAVASRQVRVSYTAPMCSF